MPQVDRVDIPKRALFRQPEVCEIAKVQPYVLRSWEAEFPDLGVAKTDGGPRVYRRADVERVLQLKHLVYVEGLTLAGARRKLSEGQSEPRSDDLALADLGDVFGAEARERILLVQRGLRELSTMLARTPAAEPEPAPDQEPATEGEPAPVLAGSPAETGEFELKVAPGRKSARRKKP